MNQYAIVAVSASTPSPQTMNVYNTQYNQNGTQHPSMKKNKGKKGEGNQNKPKPINNGEGSKNKKKK